MDGKVGSTRLLYNVPGVMAGRVLLVGMGKDAKVNPKDYRDAARAAVAAILDTGAVDVCLQLVGISVPGHDATWKARQLALAASDASYRFEHMKSKKLGPRLLVRTVDGIESRSDAGMWSGTAQAARSARWLGADLGNLPEMCARLLSGRQQCEARQAMEAWCRRPERADMENSVWALLRRPRVPASHRSSSIRYWGRAIVRGPGR
jgi:leucyl aminopeptidase